MINMPNINRPGMPTDEKLRLLAEYVRAETRQTDEALKRIEAAVKELKEGQACSK